VNNRNRVGVHSKVTEDNDFTEQEVKTVKKLWNKVGLGAMTEVYKCKVCSQLWGDHLLDMDGCHIEGYHQTINTNNYGFSL